MADEFVALVLLNRLTRHQRALPELAGCHRSAEHLPFHEKQRLGQHAAATAFPINDATACLQQIGILQQQPGGGSQGRLVSRYRQRQHDQDKG
jgi:hypothetical protein